MLEAYFLSKLSEIGYMITDQIIYDLIIDETFHHNIPLEITVYAFFCHFLFFPLLLFIFFLNQLPCIQILLYITTPDQWNQ